MRSKLVLKSKPISIIYCSEWKCFNKVTETEQLLAQHKTTNNLITLLRKDNLSNQGITTLTFSLSLLLTLRDTSCSPLLDRVSLNNTCFSDGTNRFTPQIL